MMDLAEHTKKAYMEWRLQAGQRPMPKGMIQDFDKINVLKVYTTPNGFSTNLDGREALMQALAHYDLLDDLAAISNRADRYTSSGMPAEAALHLLSDELDETWRKYDWATRNGDILRPNEGYMEGMRNE